MEDLSVLCTYPAYICKLVGLTQAFPLSISVRCGTIDRCLLFTLVDQMLAQAKKNSESF